MDGRSRGSKSDSFIPKGSAKHTFVANERRVEMRPYRDTGMQYCGSAISENLSAALSRYHATNKGMYPSSGRDESKLLALHY